MRIPTPHTEPAGSSEVRTVRSFNPQPLDVCVGTRVEPDNLGCVAVRDVRLELQIRIRRIEEIGPIQRDPDHVGRVALGGVGDNILEPVKVGMFSFRMI